MGCSDHEWSVCDTVITALITLIYVTMPARGGVPALVMFAAMECVIWVMRQWEENRNEGAFMRGLAYRY
jgi:hypothetical protein